MAKKNKRNPHPELAGERNPLLEGLAPYLPLSELPAALRREPLEGVAWRSMMPELREVELKKIDDHYWPVAPQLEISADIQAMLRSGLVARNPLSKAEQLRVNMLALSPDAQAVHLQSLKKRAGGAIIAAITGMGKSTLVEVALSVFAPNQIIVHGKHEAAGWSTLTQVAYLIVDAPHNATRLGLLEAIIADLDRLLGTDYSSDLRRQKNLDAGVVFVAKKLSIHRVGMLVVDENQEDTLAGNHWGPEFILFFLGLMNLGIPVLLLGNPMAFTALERNAQLTRRFVTHGWHELVPAENADVKWWREQFAVGETRFVLCEDSLSADQMIDASFRLNQGNPGLFSALWVETIRVALRRRGNTATMKIEDVSVAAESPRYKKLSSIAKSIEDENESGRYQDIPLKRLSGDSAGNRAQAGAPSTKDIVAAIAKLSMILRRRESAQMTKEEKNQALRKILSVDDLRRGSDAMAIIAGQDEPQGELDI